MSKKAVLVPPDRYSTHLEALAWAMAQNRGDVLEVGAGWYSTPWLHYFCEASGQRLLTVEGNRNWLAQFRAYEASHHQLIEGLKPVPGSWGVALVDGKGIDRGEWIESLRGRCDLVVVHDTEPEAAFHYPGMAEALALYPCRKDFNLCLPWTAVVW